MTKQVSSADHFRKAERALASCRPLLRDDDTEGACNRASYAMFNAAHAALQLTGAIAPGTVYKTHSGLISAFSKNIVLTGKVDSGFGRSLSKVYETRLLADYTGDPPAADDAAWAVRQAAAFVEVVRDTFLTSKA